MTQGALADHDGGVKMTRHAFDAFARDIWNKAQANYERDGALHGSLIGFTGNGERIVCLCAAEDADDEELEKVRRGGIYPFRGQFRDHANDLRILFRERRVVALIMLGEAWFAQGAVAQEVADMGIRPGEHPLRDEIIQLTALWPREFYARHVKRIITTRADGTRLLEAEDRLDFGSFDNPANRQDMPVTWLYELVPGAPGYMRPPNRA